MNMYVRTLNIWRERHNCIWIGHRFEWLDMLEDGPCHFQGESAKVYQPCQYIGYFIPKFIYFTIQSVHLQDSSVPKRVLLQLRETITVQTSCLERRDTVLPLRIETLCEIRRHVASPNDIIFSIRRLHLKHLDCAHAVTPNLMTMVFCIPPGTGAINRFFLKTKRRYGIIEEGLHCYQDESAITYQPHRYISISSSHWFILIYKTYTSKIKVSWKFFPFKLEKQPLYLRSVLSGLAYWNWIRRSHGRSAITYLTHRYIGHSIPHWFVLI